MPTPLRGLRGKTATQKRPLTSSPQSVLTHAILGLGAGCSLQNFIDLVQREGQKGGVVTLLLCQSKATVTGHQEGSGLGTLAGNFQG